MNLNKILNFLEKHLTSKMINIKFKIQEHKKELNKCQ